MLQSSMAGQKALCTSDVQFHPSMGEKLKKTEEYPEHWLRGYKTFFVLNSTEHEINHAHKC